MMKKSLFYILSLLFVCSVSHADLVMSITADDTVLTVGGTTTLRVWGVADEAVADNGLYDWGVSAVVDTGGIVQATGAVLLAPAPVDFGISGYSLNVGSVGNIDASAAIQGSVFVSNAGVALTELFNFDIEAIAVGDVQYSLSNILGDLFDWSEMYDAGSGNVAFNALDSVGLISVVPEPSSLLILSGLGIMSWLRRKK